MVPNVRLKSKNKFKRKVLSIYDKLQIIINTFCIKFICYISKSIKKTLLNPWECYDDDKIEIIIYTSCITFICYIRKFIKKTALNLCRYHDNWNFQLIYLKVFYNLLEVLHKLFYFIVFRSQKLYLYQKQQITWSQVAFPSSNTFLTDLCLLLSAWETPKESSIFFCNGHASITICASQPTIKWLQVKSGWVGSRIWIQIWKTTKMNEMFCH